MNNGRLEFVTVTLTPVPIREMIFLPSLFVPPQPFGGILLKYSKIWTALYVSCIYILRAHIVCSLVVCYVFLGQKIQDVGLALLYYSLWSVWARFLPFYLCLPICLIIVLKIVVVKVNLLDFILLLLPSHLHWGP